MSERELTINEARLIREIKKRSTYRALAEIFYAPEEPGHGIQMYGEDLCRAALAKLYPDKDIWNTNAGKAESAEFGIENKSHIGNFFWWE